MLEVCCCELCCILWALLCLLLWFVDVVLDMELCRCDWFVVVVLDTELCRELELADEEVLLGCEAELADVPLGREPELADEELVLLGREPERADEELVVRLVPLVDDGWLKFAEEACDVDP